MSARPDALAEAALTFVGSPFRLHGRTPATGLDCVGLVSAALEAIGERPLAPGGYGLRNLDIGHWLPLAALSGLRPAMGPIGAGDIMLIALPHCQHHLAIAVNGEDVVHAHAGLRQVVRQPRDREWRILARWRAAPGS
jgi:hypothetical protein